MFIDRVVLTSLVALGVGACFDPTFRNPVCGPGSDCPDGWTCAAGEGKACVPDDDVPPPGPPDAAPPAPGEPDAMPTPGPQPCTKTWVPLLRNGNFDAGQVDWNREPSDVQAIWQRGRGLPVTPDSGEWAALLGGHDNRRQVLTQAVTLPAGTERVRFTGMRCLATNETMATRFDEFSIALVQSNDDTARIATFFEWDNRNATRECSWRSEDKEVTVSDPPATAVLRIFSLNDDGNVSTLYLDTLELRAFACPPAATAEVPER